MADETQLLYLEPDDEITTVVRRLREADASRVVLVASGRTKATTSTVALRLLAQVATEEGREVALVADAGARALAAEAGIAAFASVADATAGGPPPAQPPAPHAPIHVVRGEAEPAAPDLPASELAASTPVVAPRGMEETQAVPVQRPARYPVPPPSGDVAPTPPVTARGPRRARWVVPAIALALLIGIGAALGTVLPAASVTIRPRAVAVGPLTYELRPQTHAATGEPLTSTQQGEATGHRTRRTAASGNVLLINYSPDNVIVPAGTVVSAGGEILFQTTQTVTVPESFFAFVGTAVAPVQALEHGPSGNVPELAIDTIENRDVDHALRGPGPDERRIRNDDPTSGGDEQELVVVRKSDITAVTDAIRKDLNQQLEQQRTQDGEDRIYAAQGAPRPRIDVPDDLEGHTSADPYTFELTGTLEDDQPYVLRADAEDAAAEAIAADETAAPAGTVMEPDSVTIELGDATLDGQALVLHADVTAQAVPEFDESTIAQRIAGQTIEQARQELSAIGPASVTLWPFWVDRVPRLAWRVNVDVRPVEPASQ